jgi:hypothetical protein
MDAWWVKEGAVEMALAGCLRRSRSFDEWNLRDPSFRLELEWWILQPIVTPEAEVAKVGRVELHTKERIYFKYPLFVLNEQFHRFPMVG